jgi:hypothetical protein
VSDSMEASGVYRTGQIILDGVEVYNCSQRNTFKSAIRFEYANTMSHSITNSAVHGSIAWSFSAQYSANIYVDKSSFIGARAVAFNIFKSKNVTASNSIFGDVRHRDEMVMQNTIDKESCVSMCAYFGSDNKCYGNSITNSIAAGCEYAGFVVPGHDCDDADTNTQFRDNVAHSIDGSGAHIFPDVTGNDHK